jgi:hypothetical protein
MVHDRDQHHYGGEINLATEEPQRRRRRPRAATIAGAAIAEPPVVLLAKLTEPAAGFAPVPGRMQNTAAQGAPLAPAGIGKIAVEGEQEGMKSGVRQQSLVQGVHPSE